MKTCRKCGKEFKNLQLHMTRSHPESEQKGSKWLRRPPVVQAGQVAVRIPRRD